MHSFNQLIFIFISSSAINDFDLYVLKFDDYGKDFPKEHNMSPDAFIQMCLQFTYFKFVLEREEFIPITAQVDLECIIS